VFPLSRPAMSLIVCQMASRLLLPSSKAPWWPTQTLSTLVLLAYGTLNGKQRFLVLMSWPSPELLPTMLLLLISSSGLRSG